MNIYGQVGPQSVASGTNAAIRQGNGGEVIITQFNGRLYEQGIRGNRFYAVNTAAQALSLTGTTGYTGLAVANPVGSGKNLIIDVVAWATTIAATGVGAVIVGWNPTVVALTTGSSSGPTGASTQLGSVAAGVAKVGASCTLGANPTFLRPLIGIGTSATGSIISYKDDFVGDLIVLPGSMIEIVAVTTAITGIGYISWTEASAAIL